MKLNHAYLTFFLLALCLQYSWLVLHIPFPPPGCIHGTSYRHAERQAALYEWGRHPNETTKAILDKEETRAEQHEWLVSITSLVAFVFFDFYCIRYLRRQPLDRPSVAIIMFVSMAVAIIAVAVTWWASIHSPFPTGSVAVLSFMALVLLWRILARRRQMDLV